MYLDFAIICGTVYPWGCNTHKLYVHCIVYRVQRFPGLSQTRWWLQNLNLRHVYKKLFLFLSCFVRIIFQRMRNHHHILRDKAKKRGQKLKTTKKTLYKYVLEFHFTSILPKKVETGVPWPDVPYQLIVFLSTVLFLY